MPKVEPWRGRGGPAVDRGAALEGESRIQDAVLERVVTCDCGFARELEDVHADEDGDEACEERDGIHGVIGVDALEENEGRDDGGS